MGYRDSVEAAAAALKRGEDANWELAQRTFENTYDQGRALSQPDRVSVAQWCKDVRESSGRTFSERTALKFRAIWKKYSPHVGAGLPSWSDAWDEQAGATGSERWASGEANRLLNYGSPDAKVETAKRLLSDPEVADAVMTDREARVNVTAAQAREYQRQEQEVGRKKQADPVGRQFDAGIAAVELNQALDRCSAEIDRLLPKLNEMTDTERIVLSEAIKHLDERIQQVRYLAEHGRSEVDDFAARVLKGGE